jgi:hypothetical protein
MPDVNSKLNRTVAKLPVKKKRILAPANWTSIEGRS